MMRALVLPGWQQVPELQDVPIPEPRPGEALIKVAGAGACHSDLHLMEFPAGALPFDPPFILGHENTGWVESPAVGESVFAGGDAVAVHGPWGCGHCRSCQLSAENYCERAGELGKLAAGIGHDGLDPIDAAPLTDAGLTPYHAIMRSIPVLVPGSTAVVIGASGLGHLAVQLLRTLTTARIIVVDVAPAKVLQALELGADEAFLPTERKRADQIGNRSPWC